MAAGQWDVNPWRPLGMTGLELGQSHNSLYVALDVRLWASSSPFTPSSQRQQFIFRCVLARLELDLCPPPPRPQKSAAFTLYHTLPFA